MKKRFLAVIMIIALTVILSASIMACEEKIEYSITVLTPDKKPLSDVTVNWLSGDKLAFTTKTNESGNATAKLAAGTYKVELADYGDEYDYSSFSLTSQMPEATINLRVKLVNYSVTVKDKNGSPAKNVDVTFMSGNKIAGTSKTDENGKASIELAYGNYTVNVSNLPEGNLSDGNKTATGAAPSIEFNLRDSANVEFKTYKVTVKSEGGLIFKNQDVIVEDSNGDILIAYKTNENGEYTFSYEAGNYTVIVEDVPEGYSPASATLTADVTETEVKLHSEIIKTAPAEDTQYVIGDIFHDYSFTTAYKMANGKPWSSSISEILKTKEVIILNNWGLNCSWCLVEMPDMQDLYEQYSDKIEIIAVSNFMRVPDSNDNIINYKDSNGITFPMMRDNNDFCSKFGISGWPYTVIIDRYGAIARIENGAITSYEAWERMLLRYIGDDYVQTFTPGDKVSQSINNEVAKPDVEVPEDHYTTQVPGALHNTAEFPANTSIIWSMGDDSDTIWPFMIGNNTAISPDGEYLYASNVGKPNTMAAIQAQITVDVGKVFTFDYYADTEDGDILYFIWDGRIIHEIYGNSNGWKTCYLYSEITEGEHTLSIAYRKDSSGNTEIDNVYLRNIRFVDVSTLDDNSEPVNMLRGAAYGQLDETSIRFPHYADVFIGSDGYYHVNLSGLENSELAGNDESPLLLVNVLNVTPFSARYGLSLSELISAVYEETGEPISCVFTINGVRRDYRNDLIRYFKPANGSDVVDYVPIDQFLHDMLVAFMANVSGIYSHENEWLEACAFYSHYGSGSPIGNPILGLMPETAIEITTDETYTADITRNMYPFPTVIYTITPTVSGLYKFESFIPDSDSDRLSAQIWLYDANTSAEKPLVHSGEYRVDIKGRNEQNFVLYYNLEAGHKYYVELALLMSERGNYDFKITRQTEDVTVLEPASLDVYDLVVDENDNPVTVIGPDGKEMYVYTLAGPVEFMTDEDGYFHVKNADGAMGDFIYLDVFNANSSLSNIPLNKLVDMFVQDPLPDENDNLVNLNYKFFDFRYCVMYINNYDEKGELISTSYSPQVDISNAESNRKNGYKDYTEIFKSYIAAAPKDGKYEGLIKVNQEIVDILSMFIELRANGVYAQIDENNNVTNWEIDFAQDNEWLRFCWYFHTYKAETTENE